MKYILLLFFLLGFLSVELSGQKRLRMDRIKKKSIYFDMGETLTFKLKGHEEYISLPISDIFLDEKVIVFPNLGIVKIADIEIIRTGSKVGSKLRAFSKMLYGFGLSWALFSVLADLVEGEFSKGTVIVPAVSIGLGALLSTLFKSKKYRLGKRAYLQPIDLSIQSISP